MTDLVYHDASILVIDEFGRIETDKLEPFYQIVIASTGKHMLSLKNKLRILLIFASSIQPLCISAAISQPMSESSSPALTKSGQMAVLLRAGKTSEVIRLATATLASDPRNVEAYYCRAVAFESNRLTQDKAIQDLDKAAALKPDMVELYMLKAVILHAQQEDELALPVIEKASSLSPGNPEVIITRAKILNALRRPKEALVLVDQALRQSPKSDRYHDVRAQTLKQLNRFDDCVKELDEAIKLNPGLIAYREERMTICAHQKNWASVIVDCNYILSKGFHKRETYQRLGSAQLALKLYPEAIGDFKAAIKETRSDTQMRILHAQLKTAYELSGDVKNAAVETDYLKKLDDDIRPL